MTVITREIAQRVLDVVDVGLVSGLGNPKPGEFCVEAAVCFALGLPHGDEPTCVSRALRALKIRLNDSGWSSPQARAQGLRRLALVQLGSAGTLDDKAFAKRVTDLAIRKQVPLALRAAASIQKNADHKAALIAAAARCEKEGTRQSAIDARKIAADAAAAAYAYADADANAAAYAAAYAADAAAAAYAYADADANANADAYADANADANAANAANAAANAAAYAADAANARDLSLAAFAEDVVQILIEMKAPGCQWLELAEAA